MSNEWEPFTGIYEKERQDIRLKDGTEYFDCWPNASMFVVLSDNDIPDIHIREVTHVKKHKKE